MSAAARLISGSVAAWAQIAVNMVAQIVLVPIYLNYWSVNTYGVWLAVQGLMSALSMLDMGHQNFMGYEFLRIGRQNIPALCKYLCSAAIVGVGIGIALVLLSVVFFFTGILDFLLGASGPEEVALVNAAGICLIIQAMLWLIQTSVPGLVVRVLAVFGYYPRLTWWAVSYAVVMAVAPLI